MHAVNPLQRAGAASVLSRVGHTCRACMQVAARSANASSGGPKTAAPVAIPTAAPAQDPPPKKSSGRFGALGSMGPKKKSAAAAADPLARPAF